MTAAWFLFLAVREALGLEQAQAITAAQPRAQLVRLPGVGHIPQIEDPLQFNAQLMAVLYGLPREATTR